MTSSQTGRLRVAVGIAALGGLCIAGETAAQPPAGGRAGRGQSLNLAVGAASWYDNNLLQYSDTQLSEFEAGLFPNRFSIKSRDDVTFNPSLALTWELDQGRGRRHSVRLRGEGNFQDRNPTADNRAASLAWRESFAHERRFLLRGYYMPDYYLRQLKQVVSGLYERGQFSLAIGEVSWSQAVRPGVVGGISYQLERRVYRPFSVERTSDTHQGELTLEFTRLPRHGSIALSGAYRKSRADGQAYPGGSASLYPDVSYHGWFAGLGGRTEFSRSGSMRFGGDLSYRFEHRDYESDRPADKSHVGRRDSNHVLEAGLRAQLRPHWALRAFDHYDTNKATYGQAVTLTTDPGSYNQNQIGVEVTWSGDLWKSARGTSPAEE